jgi:DNA repair exonuclease SbcCD nuclease subunit
MSMIELIRREGEEAQPPKKTKSEPPKEKVRVRPDFSPLFAAISDTHLNAHQYGLPQRAEDMRRAFGACLEKARGALGEGGLVVHCGDVFNSPVVRPSVILRAAETLEKSGLRVTAIRGNHDGTSLRARREDLSLLLLERAGALEYEESSVVVSEIRGSRIRFIFQSHEGKRTMEKLEALRGELEMGEGDFDYTVLVLHGIIEGLGRGAEIPRSAFIEFTDEFEVDLAICGHQHERQIDDTIRVIYPGAPECLDIDQAEASRGFFLVGTRGGRVDYQWVPIRTRPMRDLAVDLGEVKGEEVNRALRASLKKIKVPEGAVVRVVVRGRADRRARRLDKGSAQSLLPSALKVFVVNKVEYAEGEREIGRVLGVREAAEQSLLDLGQAGARREALAAAMEDILVETRGRGEGWISGIRETVREVTDRD